LAGDGRLKAYFLDVGQGDATLVTFDNATILIDAGEIGSGDRVVDELRSLGVDRIDLLVATHPHSDHIGGMQDVLAAFPVGQVLDAGMPHTSSLYTNFLESIDRKKIRYTVAEQGQAIELAPALRVRVLSPPKVRNGDDLNENSVVLRISYGTVDLLFTGDAGTAAEDAMLRSGYALDAEVLKVGHHGSSHSTGNAFLNRVNPGVAVISVGADNPYGHPHAGTLDTLQRAGVAMYRTDRDGTVLVSSDGSRYSVATERGTGTRIVTLAPAAVTANASATPKGTTAATTAAATLPVRISATQFNAPGDDRLNLNGEYIVLANRGDEPVLLAGWTIADQSSAVLYTFPAFILLPDRSVTVYTGTGGYNDTALFMGKDAPVWGNSGDEAVLRDPAGTVADRQTEGALG
jgi:competence protein ComEC